MCLYGTFGVLVIYDKMFFRSALKAAIAYKLIGQALNICGDQILKHYGTHSPPAMKMGSGKGILGDPNIFCQISF